MYHLLQLILPARFRYVSVLLLLLGLSLPFVNGAGKWCMKPFPTDVQEKTDQYDCEDTEINIPTLATTVVTLTQQQQLLQAWVNNPQQRQLATKTAALESTSTTEAAKVVTLTQQQQLLRAWVNNPQQQNLATKTAALESTATSEATKLAAAEGTITSEAAKGSVLFSFFLSFY